MRPSITSSALGEALRTGFSLYDLLIDDFVARLSVQDSPNSAGVVIDAIRCAKIARDRGLGAGDLLWWPPSTYDRKEIARRLRYIKPATSFRTAYAYDNRGRLNRVQLPTGTIELQATTVTIPSALASTRPSESFGTTRSRRRNGFSINR